MHAASISLDLLEAVKGIMYNAQDLKYLPLSIHIAKWVYYYLSQGQNQTPSTYLEKFNNLLDVLD